MGEGQDFFNFDTPVSQSIESVGGGLVGVGPVYDLGSSGGFSDSSIRICALFIPRGVRREAFYPLMPKPGTFPRLSDRFAEILRSKYHFSDAQAALALENLSRAGKFVLTVKDPFVEEGGKEIAITEMPDGKVVVAMSSIRLIPGYNDQP